MEVSKRSLILSKWEDTVMTDKQLADLLDEDFRTAYSGHVAEYKSIAKAQAEISFRAGRDNRKNEIEELMSIAFKDGERAGKDEVVKWMRQRWTEYNITKAPDWVRAVISGTQQDIESVLGKPNSRK